MQHSNEIAPGSGLSAFDAETKPIRQLIKARDVAKKLGVSISWVIQHASGKRRPYLPAVKMGPGRSPLRFDPHDVEEFIDDCRCVAGQLARLSTMKSAPSHLMHKAQDCFRGHDPDVR